MLVPGGVKQKATDTDNLANPDTSISGTANGGILTYISCMDTAYVKEFPSPLIKPAIRCFRTCDKRVPLA